MKIEHPLASFAFALGACTSAPAPAPLDGLPGGAAAASTARGAYLVDHLAACGACHTPPGEDGQPDATRYLAGNPCLVDVAPDDPGAGCLASSNLTALGAVSDDALARMIRDGVGEHGRALVPVMPYQVLHQLSDADVRSIVMYLRTVPEVAGAPQSQSPWKAPPAPCAPIPDASFPEPQVTDSHIANGRYLAAIACAACHTPRTDAHDFGAYDVAHVYAGGLAFTAGSFGVASPPYAAPIYAWNLTRDPSGLQRFTVLDIISAVRRGHDPEGRPLCPPMPSGDTAAFADMTETDALDIATYLKAIPPVDSPIPNDCVPP